MNNVLYFAVALLATTAGGLTGMGGGVIIKPVLDVLNDFTAVTIGVLSSCTVFTMAAAAMFRHIRQGTRPDWRLMLPLSAGSLAGGIAGEKLLLALAAGTHNERVMIIQNSCLAVIVAGIFLYMLFKDRIRPLCLCGLPAAVTAGIGLGVLSSFLGIGGGPMNVALLIYLFGLDTKAAAVGSILTILCSQGAKLASIGLSGAFSSHDLSLLPVMIIGAFLGGQLGARLNKRFSERAVDISFNTLQAVVFVICLFNIFRLL